MIEKIEAYITNLVQMGLSRSQVNERAYDYAIALRREQEPEGRIVTAAMMVWAVEVVKAAWDRTPPVIRFYETK